MAADWDPDRYARFAARRDEPFWLLASLLEPVEAPRLLDLGCGDGRLTAALAERLGARRTLGVDRSPAMLAAAGERVEVVPGDLATWTTDERFDVVISNAALQWVADHEAALARWVALLAPGGQLAVQLPDMRRAEFHLLAGRLAGDLRRPHHVLDPERYAVVLHELGAVDLVVRSQAHPVPFTGPDQLVDWYRGTLLTYYEAELGDGFPAFVAAFRAALPDGPIFLPYLRTYLWAKLP